MNVKRNKWILRREIKKYSNIFLGDLYISESGILAAAHLSGPGFVKKFVRNIASKDFNIKILCPMIANSNDLDKIITAIHKEQKELNQQGEIIEKLPPIGIMVEVPNVALNPNDFISKADFFSCLLYTSDAADE